jgi:putative membrane protein
MSAYPYILAAHIIFIVTWFAGLFYIVRLLIYHTEALQKTEPEKAILSKQFIIMERRLMQIITTPSMFLAVGTGISLLSIHSDYLQQGWMHLKLFFVVCVIVYHLICLRIMKNLSASNSKLTSQQLRMFNELATIFLVAIVFLVVLKDLSDMLYGIAGLILIAAIMMITIKLYKRNRENKKAE